MDHEFSFLLGFWKKKFTFYKLGSVSCMFEPLAKSRKPCSTPANSVSLPPRQTPSQTEVHCTVGIRPQAKTLLIARFLSGTLEEQTGSWKLRVLKVPAHLFGLDTPDLGSSQTVMSSDTMSTGEPPHGRLPPRSITTPRLH